MLSFTLKLLGEKKNGILSSLDHWSEILRHNKIAPDGEISHQRECAMPVYRYRFEHQKGKQHSPQPMPMIKTSFLEDRRPSAARKTPLTDRETEEHSDSSIPADWWCPSVVSKLFPKLVPRVNLSSISPQTFTLFTYLIHEKKYRRFFSDYEANTKTEKNVGLSLLTRVHVVRG